MNVVMLKEFFGWMTVINLGLFIFSAVMCMFARGMIQRTHGKLFCLSDEAINAFVYGYIGIYKILFIVFNLVPWLALVIMS
ncbi:DUF6868 family protein [Pontiella sulfatireligans]|uniref:DUF6868 domain-containing protein n=1 Tax=Pontiella sulfatireligans TaxID=2750658 RepID=A0A6C2US03_9BACT|nr:hypothetical protein [Pontiella sulfatireligans]VGO23112.1 hypothetical protein SCARR_05215 [Pontiella sulfatireligans]